MDRLLSAALFATALLCFGGAVLLLLNGFVEYLQTERWQSASLLELGYEAQLLRARWFLAYPWSWWLHDVLAAIPVYATLLVLAPCAWWVSGRIGAR